MRTLGYKQRATAISVLVVAMLVVGPLLVTVDASGLSNGWTMLSTPQGTNTYYYSGVSMTVSYKIVGGGNPTPPSFSYQQNGAHKILTLKTTPQPVIVDVGSTWAVTNPLVGSSSTQRWSLNLNLQQPTGTASSTTIQFVFYHQFLQELSFSVIGGGLGYSAPTFTANSFAVQQNLILTMSLASFWADAGSPWSVLPNPLSGSTTLERWLTSAATSGTISGPATRTFTYQHEFFLTMAANPSNGGTVFPSSGWRNAGTIVVISANPKSGFVFSGWTGVGTVSYPGSLMVHTVTMNSPISETGNFVVPPLTVTLLSPSNGATVFSSPVKFTVRVTFINSPVSGASVSVFVDGNPACTGLTNAFGTATCSAALTKTYSNTRTWFATASKAGFQDGTSQTFKFKF